MSVGSQCAVEHRELQFSAIHKLLTCSSVPIVVVKLTHSYLAAWEYLVQHVDCLADHVHLQAAALSDLLLLHCASCLLSVSKLNAWTGRASDKLVKRTTPCCLLARGECCQGFCWPARGTTCCRTICVVSCELNSRRRGLPDRR